jgi:hypothetical protein
MAESEKTTVISLSVQQNDCIFWIKKTTLQLVVVEQIVS